MPTLQVSSCTDQSKENVCLMEHIQIQHLSWLLTQERLSLETHSYETGCHGKHNQMRAVVMGTSLRPEVPFSSIDPMVGGDTV